MNKKKTLKKIIPFWEDTEAISPVVATILVLAVAVAAGLGLYLWFNPFQANVQGQVGNTSVASIDLMAKKSLGNDAITLSPFPGESMYTITFAEVDDKESAPKNETTGNTLYPQGNGYISIYRKYTPTSWLRSTSGGNGWVNTTKNPQIYDERFIIEIPVTLTPALSLHNVIIKAGKPVVAETYPKTTETLFHTEFWLHIDRDNNYQLLKNDETPFKGIMNRSTLTASKIEENTTGNTFYFNGKDYFLNVSDTPWRNFTGENMGGNFEKVDKERGTALIQSGWPSGAHTFFRVLPIYKADGVKRYAYIKNATGGIEGWYTNYFSGADNIKEYFDSNQYNVGDVNAGQSVTKYLYLMFDSLRMPKCPDPMTTWLEGDDEYVVFDVPITATTPDGITSTMTVKVKVMDEE
ncbi:MAG: hypothetical protein KKG76_01960 [Euryarchaeota archaeon]|nr:hypothetical protein [Euryarchaeota archaeon]